ncbi:uncharacterized protein LOC132210818 isoform X2 [Stegostoma tigrinum]|uniref:uncharacterized protein LOC132210818 isoform X2 n=1 Tax=Stegostoma tigrinum TaxID=3053191 RepID=UPI00287055EA|nr:uncharacterized protein LOC132210818 isoform X2 [Stegostoma tigrinum]
MYWNLAMMDWNNTTLDLNRRTNDWNVTTTDWNGLTMLQDVRTVDGNGKTMGRGFIEMLNSLSATFDRKPLRSRIRMTLRMMQFIYYPILAIIAVPDGKNGQNDKKSGRSEERLKTMLIVQ